MGAKVRMLFGFLTILLVVNLVYPVERGPNYEKYNITTHKVGVQIFSRDVNYYSNGDYLPLEWGWDVSSDPLYDYMKNNTEYAIYFKSDPTLGQVVRYVKDATETTFQPMALNFRNSLDMIEQINIIQSITGMPGANNFTYFDAYGTGIDLSYYYLPDELKERLVIRSFSDLPTPAAYITNEENDGKGGLF